MEMSPREEQLLSITDDCGLLAIVDVATYKPFIGADWTYTQILDQFRAGMAARTILVWDCGDGGDEYLVSFRRGLTSEHGAREVFGSIEASTGKLHLISYGALTMAAQFDDERLPAKHEAGLEIDVPVGSVHLRLLQRFDPAHSEPHFVIEIVLGVAPIWTNVAWHQAR